MSIDAEGFPLGPDPAGDASSLGNASWPLDDPFDGDIFTQEVEGLHQSAWDDIDSDQLWGAVGDVDPGATDLLG